MGDPSSSTTSQNSNNGDSCPIVTSLYYLHPGENPSAILVSPPLIGSNYQSWRKSLKRALLAKNKLKFVNGKIPMPPEDDAHFDSWEHCNALVVSWINRTVCLLIGNSFLVFHSSKYTVEDDDSCIHYLCSHMIHNIPIQHFRSNDISLF